MRETVAPVNQISGLTVDAMSQPSATSERPANWIPVAEQRVYAPRKVRVICIGAGYSGLMLAHKYKYQTPMDDFMDLVIYEKNHDVGGTWLENRYPGVACDVPAHIYTFSFEPNPDWTSFYASGPEIWDYIKRTTTKYKLDEKVQFNSKVVSAIWDDSRGKWDVTVECDGKTFTDECDVLINGSGVLNKWCFPSIEGIQSYKGNLLHSASWDQSFDWTGKRVALIGNGSSAIQILPKLQKTASHVVTYIRSPTWISASYSADLTPEGKNFQYTEEQKEEFRNNPEKLKELRKVISNNFNTFFYALLRDTPQQKGAEKVFREMMETRLNHDPELCAKLIPDWQVGCRRLTPGEGYLEALQEPNVTMEFSDIQSITETGIVTSKGEEKFDAIICATGFDVSFSPIWEMQGRKGARLADLWKEEPEAYFGICAPEMPNYFIFNGPNSPVGNGSLLSVMEWAAEYMLRWIGKIATEDIKSVTVDPQAVADYNAYTDEFHKRTVWTSGCRSWYKKNRVEGRVTALYAGSILHFKEILEKDRVEDFKIEYRGPNRFKFMGNGLTDIEEKGGDLAFYVE